MDLPSDILKSIGISMADVMDMIILRQKAEHTVYRLLCRDRSYILKWFTHPNALEPKIYALLETLGIPTLPVYARTEQGLLLEDLENRGRWRLATNSDMEQAATGQTVAGWYLQLHRAGQKFLAENNTCPEPLRPWLDIITKESLAVAAARFGLSDAPGWKTVLENVAALKSRYSAFPQTLNYSDFAAENLAISCDDPRQAVVFDYDCFSIGTVYSDWRNVTYSLQGAARQTFIEVYGPVDPQEKLVDEPLSTLEGLVVAAQRSRMPAWAVPLLETVKSGALAEKMIREEH